MKIFYFFTFFFFTIVGFSQEYVGQYSKKKIAKNGELFEFSLTLNNDNSYTIEIHRNLNQCNSVDEFFRGKGKWQKENKKIRFFPDLSNEKNEIDLSGATARFDSKNKKVLVFFNLISSWDLSVGMQKID
ncbi:hypothetical protein [Flavobacterium cheniae]|jgi:hypothetical protein|uniref:NlpE-like protein n=1 Tax=Flavobacterium cheniae TaxID=295428 RepID=A0A562KCB1_9FLAO|nr:hypothetical protein [Flavobacterium cheniae]TDR25271.1 hypothetical protein C8D80_0037 [Flavobacterium cheniae]TWH93059.1 hypothetical protein IP97_02128 [Flavobacterium cheniae]